MSRKRFSVSCNTYLKENHLLAPESRKLSNELALAHLTEDTWIGLSPISLIVNRSPQSATAVSRSSPRPITVRVPQGSVNEIPTIFQISPFNPHPPNFKSQFFKGALIKGGGYVVSQSVFPEHWIIEARPWLLLNNQRYKPRQTLLFEIIIYSSGFL